MRDPIVKERNNTNAVANDEEGYIDDTIKQQQKQQQQQQQQELPSQQQHQQNEKLFVNPDGLPLREKAKEGKEEETDISDEKKTNENSQKQELKELNVKIENETPRKKNGEFRCQEEIGEEKEIEWLSRLNIKERGEEQEIPDDTEIVKDSQDKSSGTIEPLKMIRKGAVAAVGGTLIGVGLVMIPLPTPFGAVVASSGLAVLGTEFDEAKELNDRLIEGAKGHLSTARDALVKGIESMDQEDFNADVTGDGGGGDDSPSNDSFSKSSEKEEIEERNTAIKLSTNSSFDSEDENNSDKDEIAGNDNNNGDDNEYEDGNTDSPLWLHMNPIERERQVKTAKEKYRRENQTSFEQTKEYLTKRTGKFLSRNILPLIKKRDEEETEEGLSTITNNGASNHEETIGVAAKEESPVRDKHTQITTNTKTEKEVCKNQTVIVNNEEGYVVISPKDNIIIAEDDPRNSLRQQFIEMKSTNETE